MKKLPIIIMTLILLGAVFALVAYNWLNARNTPETANSVATVIAVGHSVAATDKSGDSDTAAIVAAAEALLATLDGELLTAINDTFDSSNRADWSNLPAQIVGRTGARLGDMSDKQLTAFYEFLAVALGKQGFQKASQIILADGVLGAANNYWMGWGSDNYWIAFYGTPSTTEAWGWQLDGHHLAINSTIVGDSVTMSPSFIGIEPTEYSYGGVTYRPLANEVDKAFALLNALDSNQQSVAIISSEPGEMVAGAGNDGVLPDVAGIVASDLSSEQQAMLLDLIGEWVNNLPSPAAAARLAAIEADFGATTFAWTGDTSDDGTIYYRIQGPTLLIEFQVEGNLGADEGHYHSIYRDPTNEYGARLVRQTD